MKAPDRQDFVTMIARCLAATAIITVAAGDALADEVERRFQRLEALATRTLGGPQSGPAQLEDDRLRKEEDSRLPTLDALLDPIEQQKKRLKEGAGLDLGLDYQVLYQYSPDSLGSVDDAAAGQVRLLGTWQLFDPDGANPGSLVFILENRHKLGTDVAPAGFAGELGYLGTTATTFGDNGNVVSVLYWSQSFADGSSGLAAGRIDPGDYTDILGHVNPRTTFSNFSILFNPVTPIPDPGFGVGGGGYLTDQAYAFGLLSDANGSLDDIDWFPGGAELFKYGEIGWTPSPDMRFLTNAHLGAFHVDEREEANVEESYGLLLSANKTFDKELMLFGRLGWADGNAPLANAAGTLGLLWRPGFYDDLIGAAINVADPVVDGAKLQTTAEAFYRFDVSDNVAITADTQLLVNPALAPDDDVAAVFGIRMRFNL